MVVLPAVRGARSLDSDLLRSVRAPGPGLYAGDPKGLLTPVDDHQQRLGHSNGLVVEPTEQSVLSSARPVDTNLKPAGHLGMIGCCADTQISGPKSRFLFRRSAPIGEMTD